MKLTEVAVVILNWNGRGHLRNYLPSVVTYSEGTGARIIVADNGSSDDSQSVVQSFPDVEWLALGQNFGFSEGYNRALAQIQADVYVLLNSDVRVSAGWMEYPLLRLASDDRVAVVQPKILADQRPDEFEYAGASGGFLDALAYPYCRGRIFETIEEDLGQYDDAVQIDWASGACCFVRASAWHEAGGLDGNFFAHMEEIDLCWRLRNLGYSCWVEPQSTVFHLGGGTLAYSSPRKTLLNFRNSLSMIVKNQPGPTWPLVVITRLMLDGLAGLRFLLAGQARHCWAIVQGHSEFYSQLGLLWRKRQVLAEANKLSSKTQGPQNARQQTSPHSIVLSYYLAGKKHFSEFNISKEREFK